MIQVIRGASSVTTRFYEAIRYMRVCIYGYCRTFLLYLFFIQVRIYFLDWY